MRIRLPVLLSIATPILLAAGYASYWAYAADAVRRGIDEWIAIQRSNGVQVQSAGVELGGFPLALEADARDVVMTDVRGATWQSSGVSAEAQPWRLTHIDYRISGPQTLIVPGVQPLTVTAGNGTGNVRLGPGGWLAGATLSLADLTVLLPALGDLKAESVDLALAEGLDGNPLDGISAGGDAWQVDLPVSPLPALGERLDHAGLDLVVEGPIPPDLRAQYLTIWRDAGGQLVIERLDLDWGPLTVKASGTVVLDAALQPQANLTADVTGFLQTVDALVAAGMVKSDQAGLIKAGLALLAGPPDSSGNATLTAPLSLRGGGVFLGPLQIAQLPPVEWR